MRHWVPEEMNNLYNYKLVSLIFTLILCFAFIESASVFADSFGNAEQNFTIEFQDVGDPGNQNDSGRPPEIYTERGAVNYFFRIGTFEITRDSVQLVNSLGGTAITMDNMSQKGGNIGTHPATGITWNEAARFVNWLNTSKGFPPAYKFPSNPGEAAYVADQNILLWNSNDPGFDSSNPLRSKSAFYYLPTENEWYKAAYYSGKNNVYYDYATKQNEPTPPTPVSAGFEEGTAVYAQPSESGPASVYSAGGLSHYGTMGQDGNVWEWTESTFNNLNTPESSRLFRGEGWYSDISVLRLPASFAEGPKYSSYALGFRVASASLAELPSIAINQDIASGDSVIEFSGTIQSSDDLVVWTTISPQPQSPFRVLFSNGRKFWRAVATGVAR